MSDLLAIETSAEACSVALCSNGEIREYFEHAPRRHAELLLPAVQSLLDQAGLRLSGLDAIAFGQGPGSFTSLRIGIGVVQGLAWGSGLGVIPVSSLAAVAQQAAASTPAQISEICVAMDARMDEAYTGNFLWDGTGVVRALGVERVCAPGQVSLPAGGSWIAAGNGFSRFADLGRSAEGADACLPDTWPRAGMVCKLALDWLKGDQPLPADRAQPVYLRNKVASKPGQM
jgi:tRNA threonylcarbamoyladenosine biosynthesis protein TsaB